MTKHQVFKTILSRGSGAADARMTISTPDVDRDGDILVPEGIVLDDYWRNPVVLLTHDHYDIPVGRTVDVDVHRAGIDVNFNWLKNDAQADRVRNAFEQGVLNAASVGFQPIEWEPLGTGGHRYTKWSLLEWSFVALPSNPHATRVLKSLGLPSDMDDDADVTAVVITDDEPRHRSALEIIMESDAMSWLDDIKDDIKVRVDPDELTRAIRAGVRGAFKGQNPREALQVDVETITAAMRSGIRSAFKHQLDVATDTDIVIDENDIDLEQLVRDEVSRLIDSAFPKSTGIN